MPAPHSNLFHALKGLFALAVVAAMPEPSIARPLDDVVASKVLHVVLYDDNEPFSWSANGETRGIEVEIAKALAAKLGVEADVVENACMVRAGWPQ